MGDRAFTKITIPNTEHNNSGNIGVEYIGDDYIGADNYRHLNDSADGLMYSTGDDNRFNVDISMSKLFYGIRDGVPEDPIHIQSVSNGRGIMYEKNITRQSVGLGGGQKIAKGLGANEIPPSELIDLSGSETINWIELSLYQIIQLQGIGLFDRHTVISPNDKHRQFFKSIYPLLLIKIRAPCVFFSNEIPTTGRTMDELSTLTSQHVMNFNKWSISDIKSPEIRVWYSLQNTKIDKLFLGDNFIDQQNIQIRFWHEGGLLYSSQFNASLTSKIPMVVKISGHSIAKNILKMNNPDSWVFTASHKLSDILFDRIVTTHLGHMDKVIGIIAESVKKNNPRLKDSKIERLLLTEQLNFNYETSEFDGLLTDEDVIDPIIRVRIIRAIQNTMVEIFQKELVSAKKEGNINLIQAQKIVSNIPIGFENTTNLLSNYFDTI